MAHYLIKTETFNKIMYSEFGNRLRIEWSKRSEMAIDESFDDYIYFIKRIYNEKTTDTGIEYEEIIYDDNLQDQKGLDDSFQIKLLKALSISTDNYAFIYAQGDFDEKGMPQGDKIYLEYVNYEEGDI